MWMVLEKLVVVDSMAGYLLIKRSVDQELRENSGM
jgi:hypothetical protein